jgi:SAM-dependent methyltransferase
MPIRSNLDIFGDAAVVAHYDRSMELHQSELMLFDTYLKKGMEILDIGVGAGRTTPYLSKLSARYVGVDYSAAMIARCREKFPALVFFEMDASDMTTFPDSSFDAIVFSCNGIDCLPDDAARRHCFRECVRLLRTDGVFIFSSHNARYLVFPPVLYGVALPKKIWRLMYALFHTLRNCATRLRSRAFWRGAGFVVDPFSHGGLVIYVSTLRRIEAELSEVGLSIAQIVSGNYPYAYPTCATPWYYFASRKNRH